MEVSDICQPTTELRGTQLSFAIGISERDGLNSVRETAGEGAGTPPRASQSTNLD